ncbi:NAD-glutamate dehydrogenase, partial [Escherichia coli]|nr:NAD-glutamate dehydrogenase [Escherichia coli]
VGELIAIYKQDVNVIAETLDSMLDECEVEEHNELAQTWMERGVEEKLAHQVARLSSLQSALDISSVAGETGKTVEQASKLYFNLGD